jgi:hypothetical protein
MAVVVIGGLLSSTVLAILVTPGLYVLLDDLQNLVIRPKRQVPIPPDHVTVDTPAPAPAGAAVGSVALASSEPTWLQRLRAGSFDD